LFGTWRWSNLRLAVGLVLGTAIVAAFAAGDSARRDRLARAQPPSGQDPAHVAPRLA
jgi:hypothetical protein